MTVLGLKCVHFSDISVDITVEMYSVISCLISEQKPTPASQSERKPLTLAGLARGGLGKFNETALQHFKRAVRTVTLMRKFKRGPLTTILTIPQEQAMADVIHERTHRTEYDMKEIRHSSSAKVADVLGNQRRGEVAAKREVVDAAEGQRKAKEEKFQLLGNTFNHLVEEHEDSVSNEKNS